MPTDTLSTKERLKARLSDYGWFRTYKRFRAWHWTLSTEGYRTAFVRRSYQTRILKTRPFRTAGDGSDVEVHVLTWKGDWLNVLWALKSFYHFAGVDYPLVFHDGGLLPENVKALRAHFPDARVVMRSEADAIVETELARLGLGRCIAFRRRLKLAMKLFDVQLTANSPRLLTLDSDILFFRRPDRLLDRPPDAATVPVMRDVAGDFYAMPRELLESTFGIDVPPQINSGLWLVRRGKFDFETFDRWLENPSLFDSFFGEQTLFALSSSAGGGVEFLPDTYTLGGEPTSRPDLVCRHYAGVNRPLLYIEGMERLSRSGFLEQIR
jgi:hypothetical protein